ncbi:hypothetical protein ABZ402_46935 [Streptomyces mirabilis]|uniref:hypothetical protein n=1 Tax=Streptomyces mirabilis TaxID=68239 RepID=UPI00340452E0
MTVHSDSGLEDQVSPKTAASLRAAMTRLFEGRPQRTDGRLTKENLYKEAQASRATMNRAHAVLAEWDAHLAAHGRVTPGEAKRDTAIADLKKRLTAKPQECTLLENKLKAAHTAIAAPEELFPRRSRRTEHASHSSGENQLARPTHRQPVRLRRALPPTTGRRVAEMAFEVAQLLVHRPSMADDGL